MKYRPEYCQMLYKHLATGKTIYTFVGDNNIDVDTRTLYRWKDQYPDFERAWNNGKITGKGKFLEKIGDAAFDPIHHPANNALVGLYAYSVYGICGAKDRALLAGIDDDGKKKEDINININIAGNE